PIHVFLLIPLFLITVLEVKKHFNQEIEKLYRDEIKFISVREFNQKMKEEKLIVVDVRPFEEYSKFHIPNAISLPFKSNAPEYKIINTIDKDKQLLFYCESGTCGSAKVVADQFYRRGYYHIYVLREGIEEWKNLKIQ
ncbi:rhodanese-like domain-containing protein, partial [candidate division KSB1 bacterium]